MQASQFGRWFIEFQEGRALAAYQDSKGIWTIGVGHTGPTVVKGLVWDDVQADDALAVDLTIAEIAVSGVAMELTQPQFDALVSLTFNIGAHAFVGSTVATELRKQRYHAAADAIELWNDHGLLTNRRKAERGIFLYGTKP